MQSASMRATKPGAAVAAIAVVSLCACSDPGGGGTSSSGAETFTATVQLKANLGPNLSETDFPNGGQCYGGDLSENNDRRQKQLQVLDSKNELVGAAAIGTGIAHRDADPWCGFTVSVPNVTGGSKLYRVKIDDMASNAFSADQLKNGDAHFEVYER